MRPWTQDPLEHAAGPPVHSSCSGQHSQTQTLSSFCSAPTCLTSKLVWNMKYQNMTFFSNANINMHTHIHVYIHTYARAYIRYIRSYIQTYITYIYTHNKRICIHPHYCIHNINISTPPPPPPAPIAKYSKCVKAKINNFWVLIDLVLLELHIFIYLNFIHHASMIPPFLDI